MERPRNNVCQKKIKKEEKNQLKSKIIIVAFIAESMPRERTIDALLKKYFCLLQK